MRHVAVVAAVSESDLTPIRMRREGPLGATALASSSTLHASVTWNCISCVWPPKSVETSHVENGGVNGDIVRNNSSAATVFGSIARCHYSKQVQRHGVFLAIAATAALQ